MKILKIIIATVISMAVIIFVLCMFFSCGFLAGMVPTSTTAEEGISQISLPDGFKIEVYAANVPNARSMVLSETGVLYVGTRPEGKVYAVVDEDNDYKADKVYVIAKGLNNPNGVDIKDGDLYVAEINRILRFNDIDNNYKKNPNYDVVYDKYPTDQHHGWKFIKFGPDGRLYVPVGAPCNACLEEDEIYATITRLNEDFSDVEIFAQGVRNTVGFDWNPKTEVLWFTDNGRDWMGDNKPPDELNRAPEKGLHFGFPYCHGFDVPDDEHTDRSCDEFEAPEVALGPHVAALGMEFYEGDMFPEKYRGGIFIAEHGSWNRTVPIGYRITYVPVDNGQAGDFEVFADGWLQEGGAWGRPVDVELMPDGSMLISDDKGGSIFRIYYSK
ncbi:MAG: PQQ-dependent sugar dehydrogenase [Candidatus Kapaibacterium sp.]